ncbi:MAG TPA: NAD(P)H-dependent oxidoreductase [Capillimicrobium sp.]|nr:NAD(P)H-dependent oxidoreductase [Capillimicrobium sp.]
MSVVAVIGNQRPESRTHGIARALAREIGRATGIPVGPEVDLARVGARVLDHGDGEAAAMAGDVLAAEVLVVASPTYKATYSGLLKAFLDRIGAGALAGASAVPVLLGGAPDHRLAVDVHLTPLLLELGASVPARGLFVLESELDGFGELAAAWTDAAAPALARSRPLALHDR